MICINQGRNCFLCCWQIYGWRLWSKVTSIINGFQLIRWEFHHHSYPYYNHRYRTKDSCGDWGLVFYVLVKVKLICFIGSTKWRSFFSEASSSVRFAVPLESLRSYKKEENFIFYFIEFDVFGTTHYSFLVKADPFCPLL